MSDYTTEQLEAQLVRAVQAAQAGDEEATRAALALQEEVKRRQASAQRSGPAVAPPAGAVGAPDRGGSTARNFNPGAALAVAGMAPAKGLAGIWDFGIAGGLAARKKLGMLDPAFELEEQPFTHLTKKVDRVTDAITGEKVPDSLVRSILEGAIQGPMMAGKLAGPGIAALSGGASSGAGHATSEALKDSEAAPWVKTMLPILAGMGAGGLTSSIPQLSGLSLKESLIRKRLQDATSGLSDADLKTGARIKDLAAREGIPNLLPGQVVDSAKPPIGLLELQRALLESKASKAGSFREKVNAIPDQLRDALTRLRGSGGQTPRGDAELADAVVEATGQQLSAGSKAVNAASKADYNARLNTAWEFNPDMGAQMQKHLREQAQVHIGKPAVLAALEEANQVLGKLFKGKKEGGVTPMELHDTLTYIKNNLPAYAQEGLKPADANFVRKAVLDAVSPMDALVAKHAPAIPKALATQADLRSVLPGQFDELVRTARATGKPGSVLDAAMTQGGTLEALRKGNPLAMQEVLQRYFDNAINKALTRDSSGRLADGFSGKVAQATRPDWSPGNSAASNFDKHLPMMFGGGPMADAAADGLRRVVEVLAVASRPTGARMSASEPSIPGAIVKGGFGSNPQRAGIVGMLTNNMYSRMRDNMTIDFLNRPDVMKRLQYIHSLPPNQVTATSIAAVFPELAEER